MAADKKSDALQIQQATLDVTNQAIRTMLTGDVSFELAASDGDSVFAVTPASTTVSASGTSADPTDTVILGPLSASGISSLQLVCQTGAAITATGLVLSLQTSPAAAGDVWLPVQAVTPLLAASGVTGGVVVSTVSQRYRVVASHSSFTSGDYTIYVSWR
jgi:hypothetical protein